VKPAVVHINVVEKLTRTSAPQIQIPGFDFGGQGQGPSKQRASGSGFIVTSDGYILTNNHVVGKATEVEVKLSDGRKFKATKVGTDPETDLAVIKIDATNLPTAVLGDSDKIQQGDWVLALGSPFGLEQTLTAGIISGVGRDVSGETPFDSFIQTDASINPGNSGGPLVNMDGQVIGINSMIFTESGANQGIGFAIPSNTARDIYKSLVTKGKVVRGYLGVIVTELTPEVAKAWGLPENTRGALITDLPSTGDSPAQKAGLDRGDIIQSVNGHTINTSGELTRFIGGTAVNQEVTVKYLHDGKEKTASVKLAERHPETFNTRNDEDGSDQPEEKGGLLGMSVETVTPDMAKDLELKIKGGAIVRSVTPGGPASDARLTRGDVIHRVNREVITNADDFRRVTKSLKSGDQVVVQVERRGTITFLTLSID
jgi:serine protease Do